MKEQIIALTRDALAPFAVEISDVKVETEEGTLYLRLELDSKDVIDLNKVTEVSRILNPLLDEADLIKESYILDIYTKEKGDAE